MTDNGDKTPKDKSEIVRFPTLKERDRIAREKREAEEAAAKKANGSRWNASYKSSRWGSGDGSGVSPRSSGNSGFQGGHEPFLKIGNIPPFAKWMALLLLVIHTLLSFVLSDATVWDLRMMFTFIPGVFTGSEPMLSLFSVLSPVTHMLFHADWMHVLVNSLMMLAFCSFVEKRLGSKIAIFFFITGGIGGAFVYFILNPLTPVQLLGASSGISSLFGVAMLALHAERGQMMGIGSPWKMVLLWSAIMIGIGLLSGGDIAWQAHLGGFLTGVLLYRQMQKGKLRI
jgi:membrane associated rhomboid family serine protease